MTSSLYASVRSQKVGGVTTYGFAPQILAKEGAAVRDNCVDEVADTTFQHRHRTAWHASLNKRVIGQPSAAAVLEVAEELLEGFDLQNCVTAFGCISQSKDALSVRNDKRFLELLYKLELHLDPGTFAVPIGEREEILASHLASVAAALARLQPRRSDGTMQRILRIVAAGAAAIGPAARPIDLAMLAWAFATLATLPKTLMLCVASEATQRICEFEPQHISNLTWALSKLDMRYDPWIVAMVRETLKRLPEGDFTAQHVSNLAWALGNLMMKSEMRIGVECWELLSALATLAADRADDFDPQALTNISWSLSRLGARHDVFLERLARVVPAKIGSFPTLDISNLAYAYGKVGRSFPELYEAMKVATSRRVLEFSDGELARIVWAFGVLGVLDAHWLNPVLARFLECRACRSSSLPTLEGWAVLHIANFSARYRNSINVWAETERYFREKIYVPVLSALESIKGCKEDCEVDLLVERIQNLITWLDIDYLGLHYTRSLLFHLRMVDPDDRRAGNPFVPDWSVPGFGHEPLPPQPAWGILGREAATADLMKMKAEFSESTLIFDRFGPHERRIVAWMSYRLCVEVPGARAADKRTMSFVEEGRVKRFIEDEQRRVAVRGERTFEHIASGAAGDDLARAVADQVLTVDDVRRAQSWLPGLFAQHGRLGHCERQALLEVFLLVLAAVASSKPDPPALACHSGVFDGTLGVLVTGQVRLYVAHFCCISCLAVMCHFARRAPGIRVYIDTDDCWQTRACDT